MHTGTVVVMFSHESRASEREVTIAEFARVECPVAHVELQSERPRARNGRRTAWNALRKAVRDIAPDVEARGVLVVEDDITPADTLAGWLTVLEERSARPVTLYCPKPIAEQSHPASLRRWARGEGAPPASRVSTLQNLRSWWGSQAVWFPIALAEVIADDWRFGIHEHGLGPWDYALRAAFLERGATLGLAVPNVVQHRGVRNVVEPRKQPHSSASFLRDATAPATEREG